MLEYQVTFCETIFWIKVILFVAMLYNSIIGIRVTLIYFELSVYFCQNIKKWAMCIINLPSAVRYDIGYYLLFIYLPPYGGRMGYVISLTMGENFSNPLRISSKHQINQYLPLFFFFFRIGDKNITPSRAKKSTEKDCIFT